MSKKCISSLTLEQLADLMKELGQPAFRAKQIFHWLHQKLAADFSAMTDQPKALLAGSQDNVTALVIGVEPTEE